MINLFSVACMQTNRTGIRHRKEIRKVNLERELELIEYAVKRIGFRDFAPTKLVLFPEVFMQGWCTDPAPHATRYEKVARDIAIRIPGKETENLSKKAKEFNIYIAGTALEILQEFGDEFTFNCGFIISPQGEVIYKYHKYCPYIRYYSQPAHISPHDVYDRYIEVMDGKYGRKKGDILSCFFPVIETDIGKLGYLICNDGFYADNYRAYGVQGCEVLLRSSGVTEPEGSYPQQLWEITNRAAAAFNMYYVVACAPGDLFVQGNPVNAWPGQSMIVDFHGAVLQQVQYTGESVTSAVINLETLRKRRLDPRHNWLTQLRTEVYREIYSKPVYPINRFLNGLSTNPSESSDIQPMKKFLKERIFIRPSIK